MLSVEILDIYQADLDVNYLEYTSSPRIGLYEALSTALLPKFHVAAIFHSHSTGDEATARRTIFTLVLYLPE